MMQDSSLSLVEVVLEFTFPIVIALNMNVELTNSVTFIKTANFFFLVFSCEDLFVYFECRLLANKCCNLYVFNIFNLCLLTLKC